MNKKHIRIIVILLIYLPCVFLLNFYFEDWDKDELINLTTVVVAIVGVLYVVEQLKCDKQLKEAEFFKNFNKDYIFHDEFMEVYKYCAKKRGLYHGSSKQKEFNYNETIKYLDYFEPLYIAFKNDAIRIENIASLVEHRFMIVFLDDEVQREIIEPNPRYLRTAIELCDELYKYLKKSKNIPEWIDEEYLTRLLKQLKKLINNKNRKGEKLKMIDYRKATLEEAALLTKIRMDFLREAYGDENKEEMEIIGYNIMKFMCDSLKDESYVSWLAEDNGKIIATNGISFYSLPPNQECPNGEIANINNMFTYPDYRGQGIGSQLFKLAMEEAKKRGCKKITLDATALGRPIYEKFGFKKADDEMFYLI